MGKNCNTCKYNDAGICDRKGIIVKKDDYCKKWKEENEPGWKEHFVKRFMERN